MLMVPLCLKLLQHTTEALRLVRDLLRLPPQIFGCGFALLRAAPGFSAPAAPKA
jgi:hypothetical protein